MWEDAFWTELPQFDKFGNTGRTDLIDSALAAGLDAPQSDFYITATGAQHPMGAGFPEGALTIYNLLYSVNFGTPSADAKVIATADAAGEFPSHFVYETGDQLVDGSVAPAARIGLVCRASRKPQCQFRAPAGVFQRRGVGTAGCRVRVHDGSQTDARRCEPGWDHRLGRLRDHLRAVHD